MADFTFRREETEEVVDFPVLVTHFENGSEQRRLRHNQVLLGFKIKTPVMAFTTAKGLRDFFVAKFGAFTSFTFLNPHDNVEYTVRFEPGSYSCRLAGGVYVAEFQLLRVI